MSPWWEIEYFQRNSGQLKLKVIDSNMMPFKLLPELDEMNIRGGHLFKTNQFQINIPNSAISLHMPSQSIWINEEPYYYIENGNRIVLFQRTYSNINGNVDNQEIYLGLMTEEKEGLIVKYNVRNKSWSIISYPNGTRYDIEDLSNSPKLIGAEK